MKIYDQHYGVNVDLILSRIKRGGVILDCGCGLGGWGKMLGYRAEMIGVDIWKPYLIAAKQTECYIDVIQANGTNLPFRNNVFKQILCIEVIEHLKKQNGYKMLKELERVSNGTITLTTPEGWVPTRHEVPSEVHYSGWTEKDFDGLGYKLLHKHHNPDYTDLVMENSR